MKHVNFVDALHVRFRCAAMPHEVGVIMKRCFMFDKKCGSRHTMQELS